MRKLRALAASAAVAAVVCLGLVPAAASAAPAASTSPTHGTILEVIRTPDAGTCTLGIDYSFENGGASFRVTSYVDHCTGGGTMKYQAKYKTTINTYFYGPWVNQVGQSSQANADAPAALAGYKYNEVNPSAVTCWVPGDPSSGSC